MRIILANHGGIDVAIFINLCAAHKADIHIAALEIESKDIVHADYRQRTADQRRIADG